MWTYGSNHYNDREGIGRTLAKPCELLLEKSMEDKAGEHINMDKALKLKLDQLAGRSQGLPPRTLTFSCSMNKSDYDFKLIIVNNTIEMSIVEADGRPVQLVDKDGNGIRDFAQLHEILKSELSLLKTDNKTEEPESDSDWCNSHLDQHVDYYYSFPNSPPNSPRILSPRNNESAAEDFSFDENYNHGATVPQKFSTIFNTMLCELLIAK
jgi:hypothetical protein